MRVGLEAIAAGSGLEEGAGGARGYFEGVLAPLAADPRVDELIVYVPLWLDVGEAWQPPNSRLVRCAAPRPRPLRVAYEQLGLPLRAERDRVDVLFSTGNYRPLTYRGVNVLGLHAIQHFLLNDDIGSLRSAYLKFAVPRSARTADMTIAGTETLRRDAIRLFGLDPDRIVTVPLGPSPWVSKLLTTRASGQIEPHRLPDDAPYVLCISRLYALKNHRRLIEAYARIARTGEIPHTLVIVGGDADITREQLVSVAADNGVADRVRFLGRVPQSQVPGLYAGASAIAYVSLYETFGHPVLEAFAMGCPLLTSSSGATAELAGSAARLVDPLDVEEIACGLREVLLDERLRQRLSTAGARRVCDFSWEACAKGSANALERALTLRGPSRSRRRGNAGVR